MNNCGASTRPLTSGAREEQVLAIRRPAWRIIAWSVGQLARFAGRCSDGPDGGVVTVFLVVDGDANEGDARSIRRDLRVSDPDEVKKILLGDISFLRKRRRGDEYNDDKQQRDT